MRLRLSIVVALVACSGGGSDPGQGSPGGGLGGDGGALAAGSGGSAGALATGGATPGGAAGAGLLSGAGEGGEASDGGEGGATGGAPAGGTGGQQGGAGGEGGVGGPAGGAGGVAGGAPPVDPLEPYPAPDCDGFTAYWIPQGECVVIRGRFYLESPGSCDTINPTVRTCSTLTVTQDGGRVAYIRAEPGYEYGVTRLADCTGQCS